MGKKAKEHRKKVEKRNKRLNQKKLGIQKAFDNLMEEQIQKLKTSEDLNLELSGVTLPFEVIDKDKLDSIVDFKSKHPELIMGNEEESNKINKEFQHEFNGAGYTIEDREIDVDTDMVGEFVKYEEVKNIFPANVEGSEEFNMSNTEQ